jgi:hypothetical protein
MGKRDRTGFHSMAPATPYLAQPTGLKGGPHQDREEKRRLLPGGVFNDL